MAENILKNAANDVEKLSKNGIVPTLAPIIVGKEIPQTEIYIKKKRELGEKIGVKVEIQRLPNPNEKEILNLISKLNENPNIHGVILQLPLPKGLDEISLCNAISSDKDVDGFTKANLGSLAQGNCPLIPCTALAVKHVLEEVKSRKEYCGLRAVVIGRSLNVGMPIGILLQSDYEKGGFDMTLTMCHRRTKDLALYTREADVIVSATGIPGLVKADEVKSGSIVVDVGLSRVKTKEGKVRLVGDVESQVAEVAGFVTPVPGGVGPGTVAALMFNTIQAAKMQSNLTE